MADILEVPYDLAAFAELLKGWQKIGVTHYVFDDEGKGEIHKVLPQTLDSLLQEIERKQIISHAIQPVVIPLLEACALSKRGGYMVSTLAPRIVKSGLAPLREALEREGAIAPEELYELAEAFPIWSGLPENLWEAVCRTAEMGVESRKLSLLVRDVIETIEEGEAIVTRFQLALEKCQGTQGLSADLSVLEAFRQSAEKTRANLRILADWLKQAPPAIDIAVLPSASQAPATEAENLDSILARLAAGGDL